MYRSKDDDTAGTGDLVTVRTYLDPTAAQLARTNLMSHGIEAHVIEAASFNPILNAATGGSRVEVREGDYARAASILRERPGEGETDDGEGTGVVRCPRCELAYCFHERMRLEGSSAAAAISFFAAPLLFLFPKRWHCHRCGLVWDDPKAGPEAMTPLAPDDPIPVFRLRRSHPGMGLFLGFLAGFVVQLLFTAGSLGGQNAPPLAFLVSFFAVPAAGFFIGRSLGHDVCSEPGCRTRLPPDRDECPRCRGAIAGRVQSVDEHYVAVAEVRRELAAFHAKNRALKKKKKKTRALPGPAASA
jgi:hypothetical protein